MYFFIMAKNHLVVVFLSQYNRFLSVFIDRLAIDQLPNLSSKTILRLQFTRQLIPFNQRGVLELNHSLDILFPPFSRINNWVLIGDFHFWLYVVGRHQMLVYLVGQVFQDHREVQPFQFVFISEGLVGSHWFGLQRVGLVNVECQFIIAKLYSIIKYIIVMLLSISESRVSLVLLQQCFS